VTLYGVVLAVHVTAVLAAYGAPIIYPLLVPYVRRRHPSALSAVHDAQYWLNTRVAPVASVGIVGAGVYMGFDRNLWSEAWLIAGLSLFAVISVVGLVVIVPSTRRLADLARSDSTAAGPQYQATYRRYMAVEVALGVLVVAAVFVMAAKPH